MSSRILLLAAFFASMPSVWAGTGLTSAGVDNGAGNNVQDEPTLAQVAPVANQGQAAVGAGQNAAVPNPGVAGTAGASGTNAAGTAADGSKGAAAPVVVAPAPPPPPPDPSTLPVSVIRPVNKPAESAAPKAETESVVTTTLKPPRHVPTEASSEPMPAQVRAPPPAPARAQQPPAARAGPAGPARTAPDIATANTVPPSATADGSANGLVFYTGMGLAGIILALSFVGYMRAGNDLGRPRA